MPPEPLPWDRFKERRYDRPSPDSAGPGARWREPPPHNGFRGRIPGNGRPVPWRYHSAESDRGFSPSRVNDKFIGDEGFRPSGYRVESRYNKFNRENSDPFIHRDMRGHTWENGMSPNNLGRPHFGNERRSIDDRGSYRQKEIKGHFWENNRMQNGSGQRSFDDKCSFGRRDLRGKSWEKDPFEKKNMYPVDDKEPFEKRGLKRRSPENSVLPHSTSRPRSLNDQSSLDEKRSLGEKDLRAKNCEIGMLLNRSSRVDTVIGQSSMDNNKEIKAQLVENGVVPNVSGKLQSASDQSPVNDVIKFTSPTHSDLAKTQEEHSKDPCGKSSGPNIVVTRPTLEKENSYGPIDWKPLKWTRTSSFSSRGSELKMEVSPRIDTPLRSPIGDFAACATMSAVSSEEASSRKKPRLGWGEGLAKFERKKVEGPDDDSATKPGKSPKVSGLLECASPATPSSVACSSSPGIEDKACNKSANLDYDSCYSSRSPNLPPKENTEAIRKKESCLENLELTSVVNLSSSLTEVFQLEEPAVMEPSLDRSTAMKKLLEWRGKTLNALEEAESEIDSLENDLNMLQSEFVSNCPKPATSSSLNGVHHSKSCEDVPSSTVSPPALPLVVYSPGVEKTDQPLSKDNSQVQEVHGDAPSDVVNYAKNCENMDVVIVHNLEECAVNGIICDRGDDALCDQMSALNKETATKSDEVFNKLLPSNNSNVQASRTRRVSTRKDGLRIMKRFAFKKRRSRFSERVNALKYRTLQHLWKKDLQLMSSQKDRPKSKKRLEINSRGPRGSYQKHCSNSRFSNAGKLSVFPTHEAIKFTKKLLSDSQKMPFRDSLKMPALITDTKERITLRFISNNGLVEDPCAMEKERMMSNPWTKEEKDIFMDKFATLGKDFNKISSFLDRKTTADCVEFYYKNHKSDDFVRLKKKKKPEFSMQRKSYSFNNYLVGSGKRFGQERNAGSLDVLGEVSAMAAIADNAKKSCNKALKIDKRVERSSSRDLDVPVNERETEAANVLAGICGSISSSAMDSCITSSFERGESYKELANEKEGSDYDSCSDIEEPSDWTDEEKSVFLEAFTLYGKDFAMISRRVGTKSRDQCMVFFSKSKNCFGLNTGCPRPCGEGNNNNGGGSDNEVACVVDAGTVVFSEEPPFKGDNDGSENNNNLDELEKMAVDDSLTVAVEPDIGIEGEGDVEAQNAVDNKPAMVSEPMITDVHPDIEEDRGSAEALSPVGSASADMANDHGSSGSCGEDGTVDHGEPQQEEQELAAENSSNSKEDENSSSSKQETRSGNNITDLNSVDQELPMSVDVSNVASGSSDAPVELGVNFEPTQKIALDLNPPLEEPPVLSLEGPSCSEKDFDMISPPLHKKSTSVGTASSSVFTGYPLQMAPKIEMKGKFSSPEGFIRRCSSSKKPISALESPNNSHSRNHSWSSSSDSGKPKRNGDVILFGQILKSEPEGNVESTPENSNLKITATHHVESSSYLGLENVPVPSRSFGFWNQNQTQMGYHSLPDSAMLLAKYPAAFGNFSSTSNIDQQQVLQSTVVKSNNDHHNFNGVSVFPPMEMTGGNVVDYQLFRNQQELILEMQKRNGIGAFSGLGNPIGVTGASVAISDPVAAIKMHYAKVEQERKG